MLLFLKFHQEEKKRFYQKHENIPKLQIRAKTL